MKKQIRTYPSCCTSAYCGKASCDGCPNKPTLDEFNTWKKATNAKRPDYIWAPTVWETGCASGTAPIHARIQTTKRRHHESKNH